MSGQVPLGPKKWAQVPGTDPCAAVEGAEDKLPEAVQGSTKEVEPMEEALTEGQEGGEEPERAEGAQADPLPDTQAVPETGPESTTEGLAAAGVTKGAQAEPPKEHLLQAPPLSRSNTDPEPCVAEEGVEETPPEADVGSTDNVDDMGPGPHATEPSPEADVGSAEKAEPMQMTATEAPKGGEEPERAEGGGALEEEPPKEQPPQAYPSGGDESPGPGTVAEGETATSPEVALASAVAVEPVPVTAAEGLEEPEMVDHLPPRTKDRPETVPRCRKKGPKLGTRTSASAVYAKRPSAPPKSNKNIRRT
ncbi:UNVERIFIED_CONTAM: hypothetical protein FKN15_029617 [Acipenser sinensis]